MAKALVSDELWAIVEPLIPVKPRRTRHPGRRPRDNRRCLEGILFVLITGIPWEYLPAQFGCSGMTCWRRPRDWQDAGLWDKIHRHVLDRDLAGQTDWSRASVDASIMCFRATPRFCLGALKASRRKVL